MSESFDFPVVDRAAFGTVGEPGQRVFLFQVQWGTLGATVKLEKTQVGALCERLGELLRTLDRPGHLPDDLALVLPAEPSWVVGSLGLGYDHDTDRVLLALEELVREGGAEGRVALTREQAGALAIQGVRLVESGRPPCPLCGFPLDPSGHACPRSNGNRPPGV